MRSGYCSTVSVDSRYVVGIATSSRASYFCPFVAVVVVVKYLAGWKVGYWERGCDVGWRNKGERSGILFSINRFQPSVARPATNLQAGPQPQSCDGWGIIIPPAQLRAAKIQLRCLRW